MKKTRQKLPKIGGVVLVTELYDNSSRRKNYTEEPAWAMCTDAQFAGFYIDWITAEPALNFVALDYDKYTVIPLDELPDHVCVALAKRALLHN